MPRKMLFWRRNWTKKYVKYMHTQFKKKLFQSIGYYLSGIDFKIVRYFLWRNMCSHNLRWLSNQIFWLIHKITCKFAEQLWSEWIRWEPWPHTPQLTKGPRILSPGMILYKLYIYVKIPLKYNAFRQGPNLFICID